MKQYFGYIFFVLLLQSVKNHDVGFLNQDFRLPTSVVPLHYDLQLQPILDETPDYDRFTAPGRIKILVHCAEATSVIVLHALDIGINENLTTVTSITNGQSLPILETRLQPELQFFTITLTQPLIMGEGYEIFIEFVTPVSQTRLDGMYLDQYVDPSTNETKYVATTLFAAISARRCFPCFDEPQFKAVFTISLVRKEGYHSLSNRHQVSTEPMDGIQGWYIDKFAPSLPMSTYLVAMIVSDMTYEQAVVSENTRNENTTIRVYAPYYLINRGGGVYAANQTKTVLSQFETYFNSIFMLSKLDSVSLPRFFFSAMENWSLITYNDRVLLYFPGETTEQERYRITSIIAHEVAHHYFGNLVTCRWWTWIWLNEGSATFFSHLGVELTYPEFIPWDRFISDVFQVAMEFDSSPDTHPVANEPSSISDIGKIYDDISYEKGASLLRMLQSFLTEDVMQTAIRKYLKANEFSNVQQDDLFEVLQETAEEFGVSQPATVKEIMDTWTKLSGFPLLSVSRINTSHIMIGQEKFTSEWSNEPSQDLWWIPIKIRVFYPSLKEYFFWMSNTENQTLFPLPENEIFIVNPMSEGYFRTLYSHEVLDNILQYNAASCNKSDLPTLSSVSKSVLIDDYFTFERYGLVKGSTVSSKQLYCKDESLLYWDTILKQYTRKLLDSSREGNIKKATKALTDMKSDLLPAINNAVAYYTGHTLRGENAMLFAELTFWSCLLDPHQYRCNHYVAQEMNKWITQANSTLTSPFPLDVEDTYLCMAASQSKQFAEKIYGYMITKVAPAAKSRVANSLMCSKDNETLEKIIPEVADSLRNFSKRELQVRLPVPAEMVPYFRTHLRLILDDTKRDYVLSKIGQQNES